MSGWVVGKELDAGRDVLLKGPNTNTATSYSLDSNFKSRFVPPAKTLKVSNKKRDLVCQKFQAMT